MGGEANGYLTLPTLASLNRLSFVACGFAMFQPEPGLIRERRVSPRWKDSHALDLD